MLYDSEFMYVIVYGYPTTAFPRKNLIYLELTQIGTNFFFSREKQMIAIIEITLNKIIH